jgi:hypothetical protein
MMDRVGFERLFQSMFRYRLKYADWLRSWVQIIPPGPLLQSSKLRYYFKFVFDECRTKPARTSNEELQLSINVNEHAIRSLQSGKRGCGCLSSIHYLLRLLHDRWRRLSDVIPAVVSCIHRRVLLRSSSASIVANPAFPFP